MNAKLYTQPKGHGQVSLWPLRDVTTGRPFEDFPKTMNELEQINGVF
jgi:hypothetical protein